jgi:hypothetical protein
MAGRWRNFGLYGAQGMPGWEAMAQQLQEVIRGMGIKSPVDSPRGLAARLGYLNNPRGRAALAEAGLNPRPSVMRAWKAGTRQPRPATLAAIDRAYWERRSANLLRSGALKRHLAREGRGTRIEIYPVDQSQVDGSPAAPDRPNRVRDIQQRSPIVPPVVWEDFVDAWADGDEAIMDECWDDIINDLGSEYDAYSYVTAVGFA